MCSPDYVPSAGLTRDLLPLALAGVETFVEGRGGPVMLLKRARGLVGRR